ncbi:MAG: xanthine dehydrogenase family protein molybdopterin-binding subunit [Solirubrobacterales bacterium]
MLYGQSRTRDERLIGVAAPRLDAPRLLRGQGRYCADLVRPGAVEAAFVRSPRAHAAVVAVDPSAALALEGVVAVLTTADLPHRPLLDSVAVEGLRRTPQPALAADRVRFHGEAIAIVLAESRALAEDGAELVRVELEPLDPVLDPERAAAGEGPDLFEGGNLLYRGEIAAGDAEAAFAAAAHVVSQRYHGNRYVAVPLEARGCIAEHDPGSGELTVWCSTQGPHQLRRRLAQTTGVREALIRVIAPDVGGAFGQKIPAQAEEVAVALAARAVGRPVRWIEDRHENLLAAPHAKEQVIDAALALAADGTFLGLRARILGDAGAYSHNSASALVEPYLSAGLMPGVYRIEDYRCEILAAVTNKSPISPYRGVGWTAGHTARELLIERAARALGADPAELRRANMVDAFPHRSCTGMVYDSGSYLACLDRALEAVAYERLREEQAEPAGPRRLGVGVTPYVEPTGWGSAGALQSLWSFASHDSVRIEIDSSGGVTAAVGTPAQGQGHETMLAQIVADGLGVALEDVRVLAGDTAATPISTAGTRASRTAVVIGGALAIAADELRVKLDAIAAHMLGAEPGEVSAAAGVFAVVGEPERAVSLAELSAAAHFDHRLRATVPDPSLSASGFYDPPASYANGCVGAVAEVDVETGEVSLRKLVSVEDCGTVVNPALVDGQVSGAVVQGLGAALMEQMIYAEDGSLLTTDMRRYKIPKATDVPELELLHECSPSPHTVEGIKGVGESGAIATPGAIAAAVADAVAPLGVEIESLPIDTDRIVAAGAAERGEG